MCKVSLTSSGMLFSTAECYHAATTPCKMPDFSSLVSPYDNCRDFIVASRLCLHETANNIGRNISEITGHIHTGLTKYSISPFSGGTVYS